MERALGERRVRYDDLLIFHVCPRGHSRVLSMIERGILSPLDLLRIRRLHRLRTGFHAPRGDYAEDYRDLLLLIGFTPRDRTPVLGH